MEDFFRGNWNQTPRPPRYAPTFRATPVHRKPPSPSPKVVTIPVHFVGSETARSASALKIQRGFRGFLVRRSVRRILSIKREVDGIERRIERRETVDSIRRDARERLRLNETLMAQLLGLDSVRGVDPGVRDCRKAVIRKAIALQERVDAIVAAGGDQTLENKESAVDQTPGGSDDQALEADDSSDSNVSNNALAEAVDQTLEINDSAEGIPPPGDSRDSHTVSIENQSPEIVENTVHNSDSSVLQMLGEENVGVDGGCAAEGVNDEMDVVTDIGVDSEVKVREEACDVKQVVESERDCEEGSAIEECSPKPESLIEGGEENISGKRREDEETEIGDVEKSEVDTKDCSVVGGRDDNKRSRDLLEKMMADNEKLMTLMTQLCERSETQTRMISSLTHRVEQLERAFICDKLRRKKKRHSA